jgi:hypothetical protein
MVNSRMPYFYFILVFFVNGLLIAARPLDWRDRRSPSGGTYPQSVSRFVFKALAIGLPLAQAMPARPFQPVQGQRSSGPARNTLRDNVLRAVNLEWPEIIFSGARDLVSLPGRGGWFLLASLRFSKHLFGINNT